MSTEKQKEASRRWAKDNREKVRAMWRSWYARNAEKRREKERLARLAKRAARPATCECCSKPPRKNGMHYDHDHTTGKFRGWLCGPCNQGIGLLGDTEAGLSLALKYLKRSRQ
jgi:hypothetical protein